MSFWNLEMSAPLPPESVTSALVRRFARLALIYSGFAIAGAVLVIVATSPFLGLLVFWGASTLLLMALLIYRSTLLMHEDDQLFLGEGETQLAQERQDVQMKINKLQPIVQFASTASIILFVAIWLLRGIPALIDFLR